MGIEDFGVIYRKFIADSAEKQAALHELCVDLSSLIYAALKTCLAECKHDSFFLLREHTEGDCVSYTINSDIVLSNKISVENLYSSFSQKLRTVFMTILREKLAQVKARSYTFFWDGVPSLAKVAQQKIRRLTPTRIYLGDTIVFSSCFFTPGHSFITELFAQVRVEFPEQSLIDSPELRGEAEIKIVDYIASKYSTRVDYSGVKLDVGVYGLDNDYFILLGILHCRVETINLKYYAANSGRSVYDIGKFKLGIAAEITHEPDGTANAFMCFFAANLLLGNDYLPRISSFHSTPLDTQIYEAASPVSILRRTIKIASETYNLPRKSSIIDAQRAGLRLKSQLFELNNGRFTLNPQHFANFIRIASFIADSSLDRRGTCSRFSDDRMHYLYQNLAAAGENARELTSNYAQVLVWNIVHYIRVRGEVELDLAKVWYRFGPLSPPNFIEVSRAVYSAFTRSDQMLISLLRRASPNSSVNDQVETLTLTPEQHIQHIFPGPELGGVLQPNTKDNWRLTL